VNVIWFRPDRIRFSWSWFQCIVFARVSFLKVLHYNWTISSLQFIESEPRRDQSDTDPVEIFLDLTSAYPDLPTCCSGTTRGFSEYAVHPPQQVLRYFQWIQCMFAKTWASFTATWTRISVSDTPSPHVLICAILLHHTQIPGSLFDSKVFLNFLPMLFETVLNRQNSRSLSFHSILKTFEPISVTRRTLARGNTCHLLNTG
jgi:hypothetical protein